MKSYVKYQLKSSVVIDPREGNYLIMFRTRQKEGLLWTITNANRLEFTTLEVSLQICHAKRNKETLTAAKL